LLFQSEQLVDVIGLLLIAIELVLGKESVMVIQTFENDGEIASETGLDHLHYVYQLDLLLCYNNFRHYRIYISGTFLPIIRILIFIIKQPINNFSNNQVKLSSSDGIEIC
jgi:hypothetical protein